MFDKLLIPFSLLTPIPAERHDTKTQNKRQKNPRYNTHQKTPPQDPQTTVVENVLVHSTNSKHKKSI